MSFAKADFISIKSKCKIISALKIEMLGSMSFFKKPEMLVTGDYQMRKRPMVTNFGDAYNRRRINDGARVSDSHPRYGFQTLLNQHSSGQLPTAPAVVGGNVDWRKSRVTPATQYLHSVLSGGRPMDPAPALGSVLKLTEPTMNSIHTHY